jgi:lipopolysaccharide transport system permease protein
LPIPRDPLTSPTSVTRTPPWLHIRPSTGWSALNLGELWQYRELVVFLAWRDVKVRFKQTAIGVAWVFLQPLAMMAVFWMLFSRIAALSPEGVPYSLSVLVALVPWQYFSRVVADSTNALITDQRLVTRVYFPRLVVPLATALAALVDFGLAMCLVAVFMGIHGIAVLLLPVGVVLMVAAALGVGFWLSALNVEYRDVMHAVPFLLQFWFFATPIVYTTSFLPGKASILFALNPMLVVVEGFRWCLLGADSATTMTSAVSGVVALTLLGSGMLWFRRRERTFVDSLGSGGV